MAEAEFVGGFMGGWLRQSEFVGLWVCGSLGLWISLWEGTEKCWWACVWVI